MMFLCSFLFHFLFLSKNINIKICRYVVAVIYVDVKFGISRLRKNMESVCEYRTVENTWSWQGTIRTNRDKDTTNAFRVIRSGRMALAVYLVRMREKRNAYNDLVRKPEWKRLLWGPSHSWACSINICFGNMRLMDME
jgi:hypothetical protein